MNPLYVYWAEKKANFGDTVAPELMGYLTGREVRWADKWRCSLLGIGSVLGWALLKPGRKGLAGAADVMRMKIRRAVTPRVSVLGSGFLMDPLKTPCPPSVRRTPRVFAVRGRLTLDALVRMGLVREGDAVELGDPGLFLGDLWPDIAAGRGRGCERACIPHESEWGTPAVESLRRGNPELRFIDVRRPPREVFGEIAKCGEVFSSSLHGLVAADALGIPSRWVELSVPGRTPEQNRFKFDDYYSAFCERREPCRWADVPSSDVGPQIPAGALAVRKAAFRSAVERFRAQLRHARASPESQVGD